MDNLNSDLDITYNFGVEQIDINDYMPVIDELKSIYNDRFKVRTFTGRRIVLGDRIPTEDMLLAGGILTANVKGNILARESGADWLVCIADNLFPVSGWDELMKPYFEKSLNEIAILGYANQVWRKLISHPILTKEFLKWNDDCIMYEGYYHTHGDCELFIKSLKTGALRLLPSTLNPTHNHSYHGTAEEDRLCLLNNSKASYYQGGLVWEKRKNIDWKIV